jgi:hypothetical protein
MKWLITFGASIIALALVTIVILAVPFLGGRSTVMGVVRLAIAAGAVVATCVYVPRLYDAHLLRAEELDLLRQEGSERWATPRNVWSWMGISMGTTLGALAVAMALLPTHAVPSVACALLVLGPVPRLVSALAPERWYGERSWGLRCGVLTAMSGMALAVGVVASRW